MVNEIKLEQQKSKKYKILNFIKDNIDFFFFMTLIIISAIILNNWLEDQKTPLHDFCIENGYKKYTDSRFDYEDQLFSYYKIECDKTVILNAMRTTICTKSNKWGDCIKMDRKFILDNNWERGLQN